jgi:hypothetical protein
MHSDISDTKQVSVVSDRKRNTQTPPLTIDVDRVAEIHEQHAGEEVISPEGDDDEDQNSWSGDSEDEDDEESDQDEEEDLEPSLKYEIFGGDTAQLLEKDSACALVVSDTAVVSLIYASISEAWCLSCHK